MARFLSLLVAPVLAASLEAQATIIVDQAGGTGTNYRKLDAAIAAAKSGDILIVRAGKYNWPKTAVSKPLTIQGVGPKTEVWGQVATISGIPAGRTFVMKDMRVIVSWIEAASCRGEVLLDRLDTLFLLHVNATNSAAVSVHHCRRCRIDARGSFLQVHGGTVAGPYVVLNARSSTVDIVDTKVIGGTQPGHSGIYPSDAIVATNSEIRVRGSGSSVSVVKSPGYAPVKLPFVGDATSRLVLDPVVTIIQPNAAPVIRGFGRGIHRRMLPVLGPSAAPQLGKPWTYSITGRANDPFAIAIGLPLVPTPFLGDSLRIDPRTMVILNVGRLGSSGVATLRLVHGSKPVYRGHLFQMQGLAGTAPTNAMPVSVR